MPFKRYAFEKKDLLRIHFTGNQIPFGYGIGSTGKRIRPEENFGQFQSLHAWYTYYCLALAREHGINYLPNPTRIDLIKDPRFNKDFLIRDPRQRIIEEVLKARLSHKTKIAEFFGHKSFGYKSIEIDSPLLYDHIIRQADNDCKQIVKRALDLRKSSPARAFRRWAAELEEAIEDGDVPFLSRQIHELNQHVSRWSEDLRSQLTKKITFNVYFVSFDLNVPLSRHLFKKHFIFLHELLQ
jgi:hypothetical protein